MTVKIQPVILSGGVGSRLWPLSRANYPKQLLDLVAENSSMIQETAKRVSDPAIFQPPVIICNEEHRFTIASQLQDIGITPSAHVLEPFGRNTAPAAAVAAHLAVKDDPKTILLLLPADHFIKDMKGFEDLAQKGAKLAKSGHLITFGITPRTPETGYGYIKAGEALGDGHKVSQFREKPDLETAKSYLAEGGYYWNSGIFMFRADTLLREMREYCPEIVNHTQIALQHGAEDLDFVRLDSTSFERCPSDSIDYAVMEHTQHAAVIPADIGWNDIGSWASLWDIAEKSADGNACVGDALLHDSHDTYAHATHRMIAAVGVKDLVIVETKDVVLVADKAQSENVKKIVTDLEKQGRREHISHPREYRPWGFFESIEVGDKHQVKHLCVNPGSKLSLQLHHKRAEHWVVVRGTAEVTVGDEVKLLDENESVYIPVETKHRLANPGVEPLSIIEVQTGTYLGEDDIVRFEDDYQRHKDQQATGTGE